MRKYCIITQLSVRDERIQIESMVVKREKELPMCVAAANRIINRTNAFNMWASKQSKDDLRKLPQHVALNGKRLQKLLYLCQLLWLVDHDCSEMITEDFEAWPNGPVIPEIYDFFSVYQDGDMCPLQRPTLHELSREECALIDAVVDVTLPIPTEAIISYTHSKGGPWEKVYRADAQKYAVISQDSIKKYIRNKENQEFFFDFLSKSITKQ